MKILAGIVSAFIMFGVLGSVLGNDNSSDDSEAASAPTTTAPPATTPTTPTTTLRSTATAQPPPAIATAKATEVAPPPPIAYASDPRCAPANQSLVDLVASGFSESGLTLTNGTVIDAGDHTYLGGTTVDSTGRAENRSDVWVISEGAVYSSTGGARNTTTWPRASSELGVSPGDPDVQAVDTCVVDLTR